MGLFGSFGIKKKTWDEERSQANKEKMNALFRQVVSDHEGYTVMYAYTSEVKTSNYVVARKTTYLYGSMIVGIREEDMSIVVIHTVPELDGCGDPEVFKKGEIKKAKKVQGGFTLYRAGGMMAGYVQFYISDDYDDEKLFAYIHQPEEAHKFDEFWPKFIGK